MSSGAGAAGAGISRTMAAVIAVVVVAAIVGVSATVLVLTSSSPTGTVRDYMESIVKDKPGSAYNDTIWSLNKTLYRTWAHEVEFDSGNVSLDIHSLTEVTKNDMTVQQRYEMNHTSHIIESLFNVTVQDYCFVKYNVTFTKTEHGETEVDNSTGQFKLVQVKGSWLIVIGLDDLEEIVRLSSATQATTVV